ncbi:hypothetical protein ACFVVA_36970 [Kitasatospora sp. NPDC058048]|uniref:hypothetical protein n=1 Tax=Kitasatospora sp. NPDC058048 TaxID=3346313 RepID=UPI0036DC9C2F
MTSTITAPEESAARALATALTHHGIPARPVTMQHTTLTAIEITTEGAYEVLALQSLSGAVRWTALSAYGDITGQGEWAAPTYGAPLVGTWLHHHRVATRLRRELARWNAVPGRPGPGTIQDLLGEEVSTWPEWHTTLTHHYAEAIADGRADDASTPGDLAALYPELSRRYDLAAEGGWDVAIQLLRWLADGQVVEDHEDHQDDEPAALVLGVRLAHWYGPGAVDRLRDAFGSDLQATARTFLACSPLRQ